MVLWIQLLIALIGLGMYGFATNPKLIRIGEIMFFCGLLSFLMLFNHTVSFLR